MDAFSKKQIFTEIQRIASSRWYETRSQIHEFLNTAYIVIEDEDEGVKLKEIVESGGSAVAWVITAAHNTLTRNEKGRFSVLGGAISIDETDEDGRPVLELSEIEVEISELEKLRKQLLDSELEIIDLVRIYGTARIALIWNCSQRKVQLWLEDFVKRVKARLAGAVGSQGDLFGGAC